MPKAKKKKRKVADTIGRRTNQILAHTSGKGTTYKEARDFAAAVLEGERKRKVMAKPAPRAKKKKR